MKVVPNRASRTVTRSDSTSSPSDVRPRAAAPVSAIRESATVAAGTVSSLIALPGVHATQLLERLLRGRLLGLFLAGAGTARRHASGDGHFHLERLAMVGAGLAPHAVLRARPAVFLQQFLQFGLGVAATQ